MPQFFISSKSIQDNICTITGDDFFHLTRVRRVGLNHTLHLRDEDGAIYIGEIFEINENEIKLKINKSEKSSKNSFKLTLYMALLKGKKFDFILQKSVELGIDKIVPLFTERTIPDYGKGKPQKIDRWKKIVTEASKQCMRKDIPIIEEPKKYVEILDDEFDIKILAHPDGADTFKNRLSKISEIDNGAVIIGPEGGFSERELNLAMDKKWEILSFGENHLKGETAAIVIPAVIIYEFSS